MSKNFSLVAIIILFIWVSFFPIPVQGEYQVFTRAFLLVFFALLLIRKRASVFKRSDLPLWIFLISISINVFFAQDKNVASQTYWDLFITMFCIYYLVSEAVSEESKLNILAKTICLSSILVSLLGVYEALFAINPLYKYFIENPFYERYISYVVRPMSTQFHPAPLGSYLLGCLPFNFMLFKQDRRFFRFLGALGIVLNIVVIILAFSRGVFLGLITLIMFYLFVQRKQLLIFIFSIILVMVIFIGSFLPYPFCKFGVNFMIIDKDMKYAGIFSNYRFDRFIMTQRIFKDHPLVGLGFQHFRMRFYEYYPREDIVTYEFMIPDNMYLAILAETGAIGFLGFLIFIFCLFRKAIMSLAALRDMSQRRLQLLLILSSLVGLLVNMGGYELFYWTNQYMVFCIIVGCICAFSRKGGYDY